MFLAVALVAGPVVVLRPADAAPATAVHPVHAEVTGSEPADGALVDRAPATVTLTVDAKPATIEGDPLRVYRPDGRRVDDGRTTVSAQGRRISVGLELTVDRPAGRYEIVYRIVSADTHLIAARLSFSTRTAVPAMALARRAGGTGAATSPERTGIGRLVHGWPDHAWPPALAGGAFVLAALRLGWRRRRAYASARRLLLPPMQGHLVATRTAYRPRSRPPAGPASSAGSVHHRRRLDHARPR